ncbi:hypothetical protein Nepgr_030146 [Nepenthes gracilis]|uniref:Transmembrane protein n=1 Tax=Nepenthes gracilis TaxID=150966 RepID=A0AAD3Y3X3_NEPGR|nr:hypothetical protein Nepgr_030146 [Nepenthes gracilis]
MFFDCLPYSPFRAVACFVGMPFELFAVGRCSVVVLLLLAHGRLSADADGDLKTFSWDWVDAWHGDLPVWLSKVAVVWNFPLFAFAELLGCSSCLVTAAALILLFLLWVLIFAVLFLDELVFCCPWKGCPTACGGADLPLLLLVSTLWMLMVGWGYCWKGCWTLVLVLRLQLSTIYHSRVDLLESVFYITVAMLMIGLRCWNVDPRAWSLMMDV